MTSPSCLSLLTVNLWNGAGCPDAFASVLDEHRPDVVAAQELDTRAARVLRARYGTTLLRPRDDTLGMGLALRQPAELRELPMPRRNFIAARLRPAGWPAGVPPLEIVNVHLSCPDALPRFPERHTQIDRLTALSRSDPRPRVFAGDFNTMMPMLAYFQLRRGRVDAAWQVALRKRSLRHWPLPTWGPSAGAPRLARIDHVFLERMEAIDLRRLRVSGSDHDGILVRFRPI